MFWHRFISYGSILSVLVMTAKGVDVDCPDGTRLIEKQPIEIINLGPPVATTTTTITRTISLPPDEVTTVPYDTITTGWTGTETRTRTIPPSGTSPGTIVVETPSTPPLVTTSTTEENRPSDVPGTLTATPSSILSESPPTPESSSPTLSSPILPSPEFSSSIMSPIPSSIDPSSSPIQTSPISSPVESSSPILSSPVSSSIVPSSSPIQSSPISSPIESSSPVLPSSVSSSPIPSSPVLSSSPVPSSETITTPWTGFETRTTTDENTVVIETPACSPGVQFAYYSRPEGRGEGEIPRHDQSDTDTWPTEIFGIGRSINGQPPDLTGETTTFGIPGAYGDDDLTVYGTDTNNPRDYIIIQHLGYFRPNQAGDYTFSVDPDQEAWSPIDDSLFLWFNDNAVSGYDNNNAVMIADAFLPDKGQTEYTFTVSEDDVGTYIPFRFLFVNAQGFANFNLAVRNPGGGDPIVSRENSNQDGQFVHSCDEEVAPALEWGQPSAM